VAAMTHKVLIPLKATCFEHILVASSFALTASFVASYGWPRVRTLCWILLAVAGAWTAAAAFKRITGRGCDRKNPCAAGRASTRALWIVLLLAAAAYFLAAAMLNRLCLSLSPFALAVLLFYSYTKRWTVWTHWVLGFCLGFAPVGAWIAVRQRVDIPPLILLGAVDFCSAGFDIIRACQDIAFDRAHKLFSLPARWGARRALLLAAANHAIAVWLLALFGVIADMGWLYLLGVVLLVPVLFWAHRLVRPDDLSRVETASFLANGVFSVILFLFAAADVILIGSRTRI